jgi:hypothetical protein
MNRGRFVFAAVNHRSCWDSMEAKAALAQLVEHLICNQDVVSSILTGGSMLFSA